MSISDFQLALFKPSRSIGPLAAQVTIDESHTDSLVITQHPVERGASITDHAFLRPARLVINCAWSNSTFSSLVSLLGEAVDLFKGNSYTGGLNFSQEIYQRLLALQASRELLTIVTGKRTYRNMLIETIAVDTDKKTEHALFCTLFCQHVIIVDTAAVVMPPVERQAMPEKTAVVVPQGTKQLKTGSPSPGGALPPAQPLFKPSVGTGGVEYLIKDGEIVGGW